MKKPRWALFLFLGFLVITLTGGTWTSNQFGYKPSLGARGSAEKNLFDSGLDRIDTRLGKEIWVGDPAYGDTLPAAVAAIGGTNQVTLRVPPGTQNITADLVIPANVSIKAERGAVIAVAAAKTLTIYGQIEAGPYQIFSCAGAGKVVIAGTVAGGIYPQWWGARGDGISNDQAAFQACLNSPTAPNTVRLSGLTYLVNSSVTWTPASSGLQLIGSGMGKTIILCPQPGTTVNKVLNILNTAASDITIADLTITGGIDWTNRPNTALGVDNSNLTRFKISGVEFTKLRKQGFNPDLSSSIEKLTIEDSWFHAIDNVIGHDDYGIACYIGYGNHTLIQRCTFEDLSVSTTLRKPAIYWYAGHYGKVLSCYFSGTNARLNLGVDPVGSPVPPDNKILDFEFSGNVCYNVNKSYLYDTRGAIVRNNQFVNSSISFAREENLLVPGNVFRGNITNSVFDGGVSLPQVSIADTGTTGEVACDGVTISGNYFKASGGKVLAIQDGSTGTVKNITIQGNHIESTDTSDAIQASLSLGNGIKIINNYIKSLGYGIRINDLAGGIIAGNKFEVPIGYYGIRSYLTDSTKLAAIARRDNTLIAGAALAYGINSTPDWLTPSFISWVPANVSDIVWTNNPSAGNLPGWVCTNMKNTTIRVQANAGDTSIEVVTTATMAAGDRVGINLDNSTIHATTVASVTDGDTMVITDAIPANRNAVVGKVVFTNRWKAMANLAN